MRYKSEGAAARKIPTSPAQQGLDEIMNLGDDDGGSDEGNGSPSSAVFVNTTKNQQTVPKSPGPTTTVESFDEEELEPTGGGARVEIFYSHKQYEDMKDNQKVVAKGDEFIGTYSGSFVSGPNKSRTHKLTLSDSGTVIGLPSCGRLDSAFQKVPEGTRALVRFVGSDKIKTGPWKGKPAYNYEVALPKAINAAIKDGTLKTNYELKAKSS